MTARVTTTRRKGSSLIEILVALTLFAIVMASLAALGFQVAGGSQRASSSTQRTAAMAQLVNRLQVLAFDSLPSRVGCTNVTTGTFTRSECVAVTDVNATVRRVSATVTPANTQFKPDTVIFERGKPASANPLNLP